jgi:hypothetical protein
MLCADRIWAWKRASAVMVVDMDLSSPARAERQMDACADEIGSKNRVLMMSSPPSHSIVY